MSAPPRGHRPADVLIVGAGPAGLTLALELAVQGVSFRIVDKLTVPSDKSRALVLQPRSLELLDRHQIAAKELLGRGVLGFGARIFARQRFVTEVDFQDLGFDDTRFRLPLWLSQAQTERVLDERLRTFGLAVERGVAVEGIVDGERHVRVELVKRADGFEATETATFKYVVGCDGAHSVVRHAAGMAFEGAPFEEQFIMCDGHLVGDFDCDRVALFLGRKVLIFLPMSDGIVRIVSFRDVPDRDRPPDLAEMQRVVDEMAPAGLKIEDPIWLTSFRFHSRGVDSYRKGRLLVAGDAAHIHSPAGGQGMNTGIQDAINLGWKLSLVVRGDKDASLLDTYDAERRPVGDHLLQGTDKIFGFFASQHWFMAFLRNYVLPIVLPFVARSAARRARLFRFVSEFAVRYRRSPLSGTALGFSGPVLGGNRGPDGELRRENGEKKFLLELCDAKRYTLVLFGGAGEDAAKQERWKVIGGQAEGLAASKNLELLRLDCTDESDSVGGGWFDSGAILHHRYGFADGGGFVLLRPDLYVAYIGSLSSWDEFIDGWASKL